MKDSLKKAAANTGATKEMSSPADGSELSQAHDETNELLHDSEKSIDKSSDKSSKWLVITIGLILGIAIIILVVVKLFSSPASPENTLTYNGVTFTSIDNLWFTSLPLKNSTRVARVSFHYSPEELEEVPVEGNPNAWLATVFTYYNGSSYITFDPLGSNLGHVALTNGEFTVNMLKISDLKLYPACTQEAKGCESVPIITCETTVDPVIYVKEHPTPKVLMNGSCLIIQGTGYDLVRAADRLMYYWIGVMD
ncbi:hypothetical protein HYW21_04250 [Candidatus Woesearchaeota archaeon]|nr:hypothetical protein [Candidatus Woesearchaeota archaeon]